MQQHNEDGFIRAKKIIMVDQNSAMTKFWLNELKDIMIILFMWYDIRNNVYIYTDNDTTYK